MDIFEAVRVGNIEVVEKYLEYNGDVNNTIITGSTLLMIAASYGQTRVLKILIDSGADVNAVSYDGMTALMWGITPMGNTEVVKLLLDAKADINACYTSSNTFGATALMLATQSGQTEIVKLIVEAGADIAIKDNDDKTALDLAFEHEYEDIINILKASCEKTIK